MTVALASVDRVASLLREDTLSDADDENITSILEAASAWVLEVWGGSWDQEAGQITTERFFNVYSDDTLKLKDPNPSDVSIVIVPRPLDFFNDFFSETSLSSNLFELLDSGRVQLLISNLVSVPGLEYVAQRRSPQMFKRVEVTYTSSGIIPAPVREAVALITAATFSQQDVNIRGVRSEKIGGYSYTFASGSTSSLTIPDAARSMLRPFSRKKRARVV